MIKDRRHSHCLVNARWPDIGSTLARPTLLIPLGSTEQHGLHLPCGTDTMIAEALAQRAAEIMSAAERTRAEFEPVELVQSGERSVGQRRVMVGPTITVTASGEHQGFPGTLSIGTGVFISVLIELVRSASLWCDRVVFVNGHGGNGEAIQQAANVWTAEGRDVTVWSPELPEHGDWHAGWVETSVMLALHPELVGQLIEPGEIRRSSEIATRLRTEGVKGVSKSGVLGDPTTASREIGEGLLAVWCTSLVATLQAVVATDR